MSETKTKQVGGETSPIPVLDYFLADANTLYEGNRLVWSRRDTGFAQNSTYALANPNNVLCWGLIDEHLDNTTGNAFNNSALTGVRGRYKRGIFLCNNDGTLSQATIGIACYLASDVTGTNNGLVTVSASSLGGTRPLVGFTTTNPRTTGEVDAGKIPVAIGLTSYPAGIPGTLQQDYVDDATIHTGTFTVVAGVMHAFNFQATGANINFPVVTSLLDGFRVGLINQGTGATANTLVAGGTSNVGIVGSGTTGATAAAPASLRAQTYVANNTLGSWIPGL